MPNALRRYADFQGRSRPREYWLFVLFVVAGMAVLSIVEAMLGIGSGTSGRSVGDGVVGLQFSHNAGWLVGLFSLVMLVPLIAAGVRRLHDTDRSGWWLLLHFVPLIGWIILLVFLVTGGTRGPNRFGLDPVEQVFQPQT